MASSNIMQDLSLYWSGARRRPAISYTPHLARLPEHIVSKYVGMRMDADTAEWLRGAADVSLFKVLVSDLLSGFVSRTAANGIVNRGGMFVMSTAQARLLLLGEAGEEGNNNKEKGELTGPPFDSLLDIGAGDGGVTARLQPLFRRVAATESSLPMRWRLWLRGYDVINYKQPFTTNSTTNTNSTDSTNSSTGGDACGPRYDVISCLNVLDRADAPLSLLRSLRGALAPGGLLLLAVVLPWCPFVEDGCMQRRPAESLPMEGGECCRGATYEDSLQRLVDNVLLPCGFTLERWCKLPYLCEGNLRVEYAVLHDAVLVLSRNEEVGEGLPGNE